ncbi:MAG: hypothetical protein IJV43_01885 [Oscillospiraceae bacterium]|nr:hypothetical protein [Oscillospiraceae bacterium]
MERNEYLDAVAAELKRLTRDERDAVRGELDAHIEDHAASLREHGYTGEEADARATAAMGDPAEVGRGIAKLYRPFWLWVERIATTMIVVLCVVALFQVTALGTAVRNISARLGTPIATFRIGDDVVSVGSYRGHRMGAYYVGDLHLSAYDRSPFGYVYRNIWNHMELEVDGKVISLGGCTQNSNEGATFCVCTALAVPLDEPRLTLRYERFGETVERVVELPAEVLQ